MKHGSLFSGIGGFDLASEWMGWENVFQVEWDDYCQKVLAKNFPNVKRYGDIKEFKGQPGSVDILTGGFPCQPFSTAGKRKGESDDRYLWPEYLRIIREIQPTYVVGENVAGLVSMEDGSTLEGIFTDLEGEGYEVESFLIPACGVGAWHRRERIWIIGQRTGIMENARSGGFSQQNIRNEQPGRAKTERAGKDVSNTQGEQSASEDEREYSEPEQVESGGGGVQTRVSEDVSDTSSLRSKTGISGQEQRNEGDSGVINNSSSEGGRGEIGCVEPGLGMLVDGLSPWLAEPDIPRVSKGTKDRVNKLKGLGNAIVPQVAYEIFKAIDHELFRNIQDKQGRAYLP